MTRRRRARVVSAAALPVTAIEVGDLTENGRVVRDSKRRAHSWQPIHSTQAAAAGVRLSVPLRPLPRGVMRAGEVGHSRPAPQARRRRAEAALGHPSLPSGGRSI